MKRNFHDNVVLGMTFLSRTRRTVMSQALIKYNFPMPMYDIAFFFHNFPGSSQDAAAELIRYDKATIARYAKRLEEQGYLRRLGSPRDRRQYELYLTETGEQLAHDVGQALQDWTDFITEGLSKEEQRQLMSFIDRMADKLE